MSDVRCINYDWVEVYCLEAEDLPPRTPEYYQGIVGRNNVQVREYGTPMYNQMFTILFHRKPLLEVRRDPMSRRSNGGIFPDNCCHVRLSNRVCYYPDPIGFLLSFLRKHHLQYISTKRIDICLDFNRFDGGDDPAAFLRRYHAGRYAKMYQREFADHGKDGWQSKLYNSVKWGSLSSDITVKLYNKTMELNRAGKDKPYIREAWKRCGLSLDKDVWRVEFSIQSQLKNMVKEDDGSIMPVDIMIFRTREDCLNMFMMLADRYFDFRYVEKREDGRLQRKDRCSRKMLFDIKPEQQAYRPIDIPTQKSSLDKSLMMVVKRLAGLAIEDANNVQDRNAIRRTCSIIVNNYAMNDFYLRWMHGLMEQEFLPAILLDLEQSERSEG